jgi:hypothetical protein
VRRASTVQPGQDLPLFTGREIGKSRRAPKARPRHRRRLRHRERLFLQGPPKVWVEQLAELTLTEGMSVYILYRVESADVIRWFAAEVAPAVREIVTAERARA